ncbi:hypothetical protein UPYG_G00253790 [Umbra pygmaea]|uniref:Proline rich membrane anchor 1 n=1 Tax=Umbra pygmaea TaxID=75934 RepID=A0ABD0W8G2_UMBPY
MLLREILPLLLVLRHFVFGHCFLTTILLLYQFTQGEPQKSCAWNVEEKAGERCQLACQCNPYHPLPPPPPPPPPPRLQVFTVSPSTVAPVKPWWMDIMVLGLLSCASAGFTLLLVIICYKAMKRKPPRKEENGTSRGEYAMSLHSKKTVDTRNTRV